VLHLWKGRGKKSYEKAKRGVKDTVSELGSRGACVQGTGCSFVKKMRAQTKKIFFMCKDQGQFATTKEKN